MKLKLFAMLSGFKSRPIISNDGSKLRPRGWECLEIRVRGKWIDVLWCKQFPSAFDPSLISPDKDLLIQEPLIPMRQGIRAFRKALLDLPSPEEWEDKIKDVETAQQNALIDELIEDYSPQCNDLNKDLEEYWGPQWRDL